MRGLRLKRLLAVAGVVAVLVITGGALLAGSLVVAGPRGPGMQMGCAGNRVARGAERLALLPARVAFRVAERVARSTVREASAQSKMQFESTPEESARAFDERLARRRAAAAVPAVPAPVSPRGGSVPEPDAPAEPLPPSSSGDIVRIGSDIHVEEGQTVDGDVVVFGADARIDGHVRGNVSVTQGDLYLGSGARVDGDVLCFRGEIHEEDGATVLGQRVTGLQRRHMSRTRIHRGGNIDVDYPGRNAFKVARRLTYALMWLLLAWAIARFAAGRTTRALDTLRREPAASIGWGFALMLLLMPSVVALALVVALLCITIIGIPVAMGVMVAYAGMLVVLCGWGYVVGAIALGERFASRGGAQPSLVRSAVFGVLAIQGAMLVSAIFGPLPIIGWMAGALWVLALVAFSVVTLLGIGALIRSKFGQGPDGVWWPPTRLFGPLNPVPAGYPPPPPPPGYTPPYTGPPAYTPPPASQAYGPGQPQTWPPPAPPPGYVPPAPPPGYAPPAPPQGYVPPASPPGYAPPAPPPGYVPPAPPPPTQGYVPPPPPTPPPPPVG